MQLRPYQAEAREAVHREWDQGHKRTLLTMATGTGKTITFASIAADQVAKGERVLVLAHRGELLDQAADKIDQAVGLGCAVDKAEQSALDSHLPITVGSVQTLMREARLHQYSQEHYGTIIVDEAHHVMADSYQRILSHFNGAKVLGVTATPDRGDLKDLGETFDSLAYDYSLFKAIKEGYLSPIKAMTIPLEIDISEVGMSAGDYSLGDIGHALDPYLDAIADQIKEHASDRKTVIFLPLIATSQKMCRKLQERGVRAAEVNGQSPDRAQVLKDFDEGRYQVLCNSMLLTEGWDCPSVDCIVVLRPTKIRSLYAQMIGRGTRLYPGKDELLVLDFLWHTERHSLCKASSLVAKKQDIAARMDKLIEAAGTDQMIDLEEALEEATTDATEEREAALAAELAQQRKKKQRLVDPLQYAFSIHAEDLASYSPSFRWEMAPPTQKQLEMLEKSGISAADVANAGLASQLIDRVITRRSSGLCTPKQIRLLEQRGFQHVGMWSFEDASNMISRIASNNWRVPYGIRPSDYRPDRRVS